MPLPFQTTLEELFKLSVMIADMKNSDLDTEFVHKISQIAMIDQCAFDLIEMWHNAKDSMEKQACIDDLKSIIKDYEKW